MLPIAPGLRPMVEAALASEAPGLRIQLLDGRSHEALAACDLTLIASGTATLEAALFKRPMVVAYRLHHFNHWLMQGKAYLPWFSLPNILLRDFAVPELIQDAATPEAIAAEALAWLDDGPRRDALHARFTELHLSLRQDTAQRASHAIAQVLGAA